MLFNIITCYGTESTEFTHLIQQLTHGCLNEQCFCFTVVQKVSELKCLQGNSIQKMCKVLDSISSNVNEDQHLTCIKKAHVLPWKQSPHEKVQRELTHQHPHSWSPARHSGASVSLLCDWAICQRGDTSVSTCANSAWTKYTQPSQPNFQSPETSYFPQSHR